MNLVNCYLVKKNFFFTRFNYGPGVWRANEAHGGGVWRTSEAHWGGGGFGANEAHGGGGGVGANEAQGGGGLALTRRAPSPICASYNEARSFSQTLLEKGWPLSRNLKCQFLTGGLGGHGNCPVTLLDAGRPHLPLK